MQNTNSSAIKKHWAHTNDHSPHGLKISWLEHNLGAKSKKENTAPSRGALVPWWGSGGGCLIVLASWILFRKYGYLQRMESKTGKSTPRVAFIFPNEEISLCTSLFPRTSESEFPPPLISLLLAPTKDSELLKPNCIATIWKIKSALKTVYLVQ